MGDKLRHFSFQLVLQYNVAKQRVQLCCPLIIMIIIIIIIIIIMIIIIIIIIEIRVFWVDG